MEMLLIILAVLCVLIGVIGAVVPALPGGVLLSYVGLLLMHFTKQYEYETDFLILWGVLVGVALILDYYIPIWGTKKFGGSKMGVWGCMIGMIVGIFFGPWGILLGPFVGAVIGELIVGKKSALALKAGLGSFLGFLVGTVIKVVMSGFLLFYVVRELF